MQYKYFIGIKHKIMLLSMVQTRIDNNNIISIFKEDNVFSMTANLSYSPLMNTDNAFYQAFLADLLSDAVLVV